MGTLVMSDSNTKDCDLPVMGLAGVTPGIRSLAGRTLVDGLAEGDSVYMIAVDPTESRIAGGTKRGKIFLLERTDAFHYELSQVLDQGAPVLAIDWLDQERLIVSDTTSRCLIWHPPSSSPHVVRSSDPICAFMSVGTMRMGLTITGSVLLWGYGFQTPPRTIKAPPPPKPFSWVSGVHWSSGSSVLFPAHDGSLTSIDATSYRITEHPAHRGEFYALHELDDGRLLTIGHRDRRAFLWRPNPMSIESELAAPLGVFAIMLTGDLEAPLALIYDNGSAIRCAVEENQLVPVGEPTIAAFRCGAGVSVGTYRKAVQQHRKQRIDASVHGLQARLAAGDTSGCAEWVNALRAEGREDLALAFEAEMAAVSKDVSAELARRVALCASLPDREGSIPSLLRLAHLLVRLFLYPKAGEALKRIAAIMPNADIEAQIAHVEHIARVAAANQCICKVESPQYLLSLIKTWDVVQAPWQFRTILRTWDSIDCRDLPVSGEDFVRVCRLPGSEDRTANGIEVESVNLHVVSGWQITAAREFVLFRNSLPEPKGFEVALQLEAEGNRVLAYPMLLFSPEPSSHVMGMARHNQACIGTLNALLQEGRGQRWISRTACLAEDALKRLIAEKLAEMRRRVEV